MPKNKNTVGIINNGVYTLMSSGHLKSTTVAIALLQPYATSQFA